LKKAPHFSFNSFGAKLTLFRRLSQGECAVVQERKGKGNHSALVLVAVIVLLALTGEVRAVPYRLATAVSIQSEYTAPAGSVRPHTQVWRVVPETASDGSTLLRFFLEAAAADGVARCELRLPPAGAEGEIQWKGVGKTGQKKSGTGLLLVPGFPVPCDVLPVDRRQDSGRVYEELSEAGGRAFSRSYRISFAAISFSEAKSAGWIRGEEPGTAGLVMVTLTDEKERLAVKQLWSADGSWWLYEETPLRRSWLIQ
jgi:hypothetical protein